MSEQEAEEKSGSEPKYPSPVKRFILTVIGLLVFITIGEIAPRFLFNKNDKPVATNIAENAKKPVESHINPVAEQPVATPETPSSPPPSDVTETTAEPAASNPIANQPAPAATEPATTQSSTEDKEHLRTLEEKITSLEETHKTEISDMQKKLEAQNIESQHKSDSVISSLIIFGQLKDAVNNGKPYADELNQLKKITADNTEAQKTISLLEPDAGKGIILLDKLKANFTHLIKQALTNKNESSALKILHKFITIRKIGEQSGSTDEAILARAEMKLAQDDLSAALSELEQLPPDAKEVFKDWRENAQKLLDTQKTLSNLQLLLTQTNSAAQP